MLSQEKTKPIALEAKALLKRAETKLEEGRKALTEWQKQTKVVDRSEFGRATVNYNWDDTLASISKDE